MLFPWYSYEKVPLKYFTSCVLELKAVAPEVRPQDADVQPEMTQIHSGK